jgi:maltose/maltodextrin transport system substrate-binding protein
VHFFASWSLIDALSLFNRQESSFSVLFDSFSLTRGKLAMMISGPWAWSNLIKNGIDFGVAPIPGVDENVGRPFVGVTVAYANRSSPNQDLIKEFLEHYALTEEALTAIYHAKPTGVPALISIYEKLAKDNPLLRQLEAAVESGRVHAKYSPDGPFF